MALKKITHRDNVHLTESGYKLLAGKIVKVSKELKDRHLKPQQQPPVDPLTGMEIISWGGFYITVGCRRKLELKAPVKKGLLIGGTASAKLALRTCLRTWSVLHSATNATVVHEGNWKTGLGQLPARE